MMTQVTNSGMRNGVSNTFINAV